MKKNLITIFAVLIGLGAAAGQESSVVVLPLRTTLNVKTVEGWKFSKGDWAVRSESMEHDLAGGPPALCTLSDGTAVYTDAALDNFSFSVKFRNASVERGWWYTRVWFRIQPQNQALGYFVQRSRAGKIQLGLTRSRGDDKILGESIRIVPASTWLWLRINAQGNRFLVEASTDGLTYNQVIDTSDADNTFQNGYCGVSTMVHSHFQFNLDPWGDDPNRKSNGIWFDALTPTGIWHADNGQPVRVNLEARMFSMVSATAGTCKVKFGEETFPVGALRAGENTLHFDIPFPKGQTAAVATVVLLDKSNKELERASVNLNNPLVFSSVVSATAPTGTLSIGAVKKAEYLDYLKKLYLDLSPEERRKTSVVWNQTIPGMVAELYEATGDEKYLDELKTMLVGWLKDYRMKGVIQGMEFVGRGPFCKAVCTLVNKGNLSSEDRADLFAMVSDMMVKGTFEGGGCMNRSLGYQLGLRQMLQLIPKYPLRDEITGYIENAETSIIGHLEELENSTNYQGISLYFIIQWIELNHRQDLYLNPKLKNTFERMLRCQTPCGGMAPYGDYGNVDNTDIHLVAAFEKAAAVYRDGRFKTAARQLFDRIQEKHEPLSGWTLWGLSSVYLWADDTVAPTPKPEEPVVTYRNNGDADKVILRNKNAYALFDMINGREHGDNNTLGLMAYIVNSQYRIFDQGGRYPDTHSRTLVADSAEDFPFGSQRRLMGNPAKPGCWALAEIYLPNHWSWMNFAGGAGAPTQYKGVFKSKRHADFPNQFTYFPEREFTLITTCGGSGKNSLLIDDVKLVDKDGNEKLLASFEENVWGWVGNAERADEGFSSAHSARFFMDLDSGINMFGRVFPMLLDVDNGNWKKLRFRYKIEEPASEDFDLVTVTVGDIRGYPRNYPFHHNPMFTGSVEAFNPAANTVRMRLNENDLYGRPQSKVRDAGLLDDGTLVIRDTISIKSARDYVCGPVFHIEKVLSQGDNWFETAADGRVLVWFAPRENTVCGIGATPRSLKSSKKVNSYAIYQKFIGDKPAAEVFTTVLLPLAEGASAAEAAKGLKAQFNAGKMNTIFND